MGFVFLSLSANLQVFFDSIVGHWHALEKSRLAELPKSKGVFSTFQLLQLVTDISSHPSHLFLVHREKKDLQPCCLSALTQTVNRANMS